MAFTFFLMGLVATSPVYALGKHRPDAAPLILQAFQGSCSSQGAMTAAANAQMQSIIGIIKDLQATQACKPYQEQLSGIATAAGQMQSLQADPSYTTYQTDQNQLQILTRALQGAQGGSAEATALTSAIQSVRTQMYSDQATYNAAKQTSKQNLIATNSAALLNLGHQLVSGSSSTDLYQCLSQSPAAAVQIGNNIISYAATFLPSYYGAGVAAVAQLMNLGLQLFRDGEYDGPINGAYADQMPDALNCALESMTDSYCSADDSYQLVELARKNRDGNYKASPLWQGLDILGRQLPAVISWLDKIKNGVPPMDSYQSAKQSAAIMEVVAVEVGNLQAVATINNAIAQYEAAPDVTTKNADMVNAIAQIALASAGADSQQGVSSRGPMSNPFSTFSANPFYWACWLVNGYSPLSSWGPNCPDPGADNPPQGSPSQLQINDYILNRLASGGAAFPQIKPMLLANWTSVETKVQDLANTDFARNITTDAGALLSKAFSPSDGYPLSARAVLANIDDYINAMIDYGFEKNPQLPQELVIEKTKLEEAIHLLDAPDADACPPEKPTARNPEPKPFSPAECQRKRLVRIFEIFELQNNTQVFSTEVQSLVSIDLQNRFANGEFPKGKTDILKAAGLDLYVRLQEAGAGDLDPLTRDLNNARGDFEANIRAFRQFFVRAFEGAVRHEAVLASSEDPGAGPNRPHGQKLGQLCLFWLTTSQIPGSKHKTLIDWPSTATQNLCRQATYYNGNDNENEAGKFTPAFTIAELEKQLSPAHFESRVCLFHKYKIHNKAITLYLNGTVGR